MIPMIKYCADCKKCLGDVHGSVKMCVPCQDKADRKSNLESNRNYYKRNSRSIYRNNGVAAVKKLEPEPYLKVINEISKLPMGAWG